MQRRMNPGLFGSEFGTEVESYDPGMPVASHPNQSLVSNAALPRPTMGEFQGLEARVENHSTQLNELNKNLQLKFSRNDQRFTRIEEKVEMVAQELKAKQSQLAAKISERTLMDHKIESMLERHNQVIRTFENRLSSMQKLLDEQELHNRNLVAALQDARREIARLKGANH